MTAIYDKRNRAPRMGVQVSAQHPNVSEDVITWLPQKNIVAA